MMRQATFDQAEICVSEPPESPRDTSHQDMDSVNPSHADGLRTQRRAEHLTEHLTEHFKLNATNSLTLISILFLDLMLIVFLGIALRLPSSSDNPKAVWPV